MSNTDREKGFWRRIMQRNGTKYGQSLVEVVNKTREFHIPKDIDENCRAAIIAFNELCEVTNSATLEELQQDSNRYILGKYKSNETTIHIRLISPSYWQSGRHMSEVFGSQKSLPKLMINMNIGGASETDIQAMNELVGKMNSKGVQIYWETSR